MSCVTRRNSIGHSYRPVCFLFRVNARERFASAKTNFWWVPTVKAAFPWKILRLHWWTSWKRRNTRANDSRSGTDNKFMRKRRGGGKKPFADRQRHDNQVGS